MLWSDFQDTAERLVRGPTEADWRSAISRAYYAVFHYFREFLFSHGVDIGRSGISHNNLYIGLLNSGLQPVDDFGRRVDDLRIERTAADYNLVIRFNQGPARDTVKRARINAADFQALLVSHAGAQIAAGVRRYLRSVGRIP